MRQYLYTVLIFAATRGCSLLHGEQAPPTVAITTPATTIEVYDTLVVTVTIDAPTGFQVDLEKLRHRLLQPRSEHPSAFKLLEEQVGPPTPAGAGRYQQEFTYTLDPWQEGQQVVSISPVIFQGPEGEVKAWGDILNITIRQVDTEKTEALLEPQLLPFRITPGLYINPDTERELAARDRGRDPQHKLELFQRRTLRWRWLLGLIAIFAAGYLLRNRLGQILQRLRQSQQTERSPRDEALTALQQLREADLPKQHLFEVFYVKVTEIIRIFIEREYRLKAPEHTTEEFLQELVGHPQFGSEVQQSLCDFLSYGDLVKFAQHHPSTDDCSSTLTTAERFVRSSSNRD